MKTNCSLIAGALLLGGALTAVAGSVKIELPPETPVFKTAPGAELVATHCLICHSSEYVSTQPKLPRTFWKGSVEKMQQKFGAQIPPEQVETLVDYLVKNYGTEQAPK